MILCSSRHPSPRTRVDEFSLHRANDERYAPFRFGAFLLRQVGDSVVQFFHKTKAEMVGDANTMGAGATVLVKGLVGGTFGSAAKITGAFCALLCFVYPEAACVMCGGAFPYAGRTTVVALLFLFPPSKPISKTKSP